MQTASNTLRENTSTTVLQIHDGDTMAFAPFFPTAKEHPDTFHLLTLADGKTDKEVSFTDPTTLLTPQNKNDRTATSALVLALHAMVAEPAPKCHFFAGDILPIEDRGITDPTKRIQYIRVDNRESLCKQLEPMGIGSVFDAVIMLGGLCLCNAPESPLTCGGIDPEDIVSFITHVTQVLTPTNPDAYALLAGSGKTPLDPTWTHQIDGFNNSNKTWVIHTLCKEEIFLAFVVTNRASKKNPLLSHFLLHAIT